MSLSVLLGVRVGLECKARGSRKSRSIASSEAPLLKSDSIVDEEHGLETGSRNHDADNDSIFSFYGTFEDFSQTAGAEHSDLNVAPPFVTPASASTPKKLLRWGRGALPSMPESFPAMYELIKTFPRISMAPVHLVRHRETGKQLIIKQLQNQIICNDQLLPEEAYILTKVLGDHRNILGINDIHAAGDGVHREYSNVVMDFCNGGDVNEVIDACFEQGKQVPPEFILHFVSSMIDALAFIHHGHVSLNPKTGRPIVDAHQPAILHCDIKPDNIFLNFSDESSYGLPDIMLADFGLAGFEDVQGIRGTKSYFPPEFLAADILAEQSDKNFDETHSFCSKRTDMYSFAATLYELITLRLYVPGDDIKGAFRNSNVAEHIDILFILESGLSERAEDRDLAGSWHYVSFAFKQRLQLWHDAGGRMPSWFGQSHTSASVEGSRRMQTRSRGETPSRFSIDIDEIIGLEDSCTGHGTFF